MANAKVTRIKARQPVQEKVEEPKTIRPTGEMIPYQAQSVPAARLRILVEGRSPLLTHNPQSMTMVKDAMRGGRVPTPEDEAEIGCYRLPDGGCGIKGESFRGSLLGAAGQWRMKKSSARTRLAHITVVEELLPLLNANGTSIKNYAIDRRRAIIQGQGIIRARPRFDEWFCMPTFEFDPVLVPDYELIINILADAGGRIGVGDYRPSSNGWFGRFSVVSYQIL